MEGALARTLRETPLRAATTGASIAEVVSYAGQTDPRLFRRVRTWFLLFAMLLLAQENGIFTTAQRASEKLKIVRDYYAPSSALFLLTALLWAICVGLIATRLTPTIKVMLEQKAICAFLVLAFLSTVWSQDPQLTFRKAILLLLIFSFGWCFAASYSPADQIRILLVAGVIVALASTAMALFLPQYGLDLGGAWKGILAQKNQMAHAILFLFSGCLFRPISTGRDLLMFALQAALAMGLIILSHSQGSLLLAVLLVAVRIYGPFLKNRRREQVPFVLYTTTISILAIMLCRNLVLSLIGRDSTLTGRTNEWAVLMVYVLRHLWLGYGYQAFWTGTGDSLRAMTAVGGAMRGADSGYIDTMLQLGMLGMALWLILFVVVLRDFFRLMRETSVPLAGYWHAGIILTIFVGSYTEAMFLVPAGVSTFLCVVACAGLRTLSLEGQRGLRGETAMVPSRTVREDKG